MYGFGSFVDYIFLNEHTIRLVFIASSNGIGIWGCSNILLLFTRRRMIKLIYKLFRRQLNALVFEENESHKDWRDNCEVGFVDDNGNKYYRYKPDYKMPIQRMSYVDTLKLQYVQTWGQQEQVLYDNKLRELFSDLESQKSFKQYYKKLANLVSLLDEKKLRENHVIQTDVLLNMVSCLLIREDEDPTEVNEKILAQKIETFKKKISWMFLKQQSILDWMGLSHLTEEEFTQLWELSQSHINKRAERLSSIIKE